MNPEDSKMFSKWRPSSSSSLKRNRRKGKKVTATASAPLRTSTYIVISPPVLSTSRHESESDDVSNKRIKLMSDEVLDEEPMVLGTQPRAPTAEVSPKKIPDQTFGEFMFQMVKYLNENENVEKTPTPNPNEVDIEDFIKTFKTTTLVNSKDGPTHDPTFDDNDKKFYFRRLTSNGYGLVKGSSTGYDLKSAYMTLVPRGGSALVMTDLQIILPKGVIGTVYTKFPQDRPGIIGDKVLKFNSEYREKISFIIKNQGAEDIIIDKGQVAGQLICKNVTLPDYIEL